MVNKLIELGTGQRRRPTPGQGVSARNLAGGALPGALVMVTGGGSGIGRATALAFAEQGCRVVNVDINLAAAEQTAAACAARVATNRVSPPASLWKSSALSCDMGDWSSVAAVAERAEDEYGPVDVLVNNAGVGMTGRFLDTSMEDWRWIRSVNLDGVVHGCAAFGPAMVGRGAGQIVNVSSGLAYTPRATEVAYVTTKAAVLALSQCLRADWSPHGVGVTAICPGVINTPIVAATRYLGAQADAPVRERVARLFRHGHPPEMVAEAIVDAVRRDPAVVPVGWEARLGWWGHRLLPLAVSQLAARRELG